MMSNLKSTGSVSYNKLEQIAGTNNAGALLQGYDTQGAYQPNVIQYDSQYTGYQQPQNAQVAQYQQYAAPNTCQGYVHGDNYTVY